MNARFPPFFRCCGASVAAACLVATPGKAQTAAELDIGVYAGLTVKGDVGSVYSIEYVPELAQTNIANAWHCLEYFQLPASPYLWLDTTAPVTGKRFYRAVQREAPPNMVFIPPGSFRMGSPPDEAERSPGEGPLTVVIITKGFWMGSTEVTQGDYEAVMDNPPDWIPSDPSLPADLLSWLDATEYCQRVTDRERAAGRIASNSEYRLPTEAEWEYACRAWTSTRFSYGDDPGSTRLSEHAWYRANSDWSCSPVGQLQPNPWGLYDMHGNVWEWCQDRGGGEYPGGIVVDPQGSSTGPARVTRGGHWGDPAASCRSASRNSYAPDRRGARIGFRVVLSQGSP